MNDDALQSLIDYRLQRAAETVDPLVDATADFVENIRKLLHKPRN